MLGHIHRHQGWQDTGRVIAYPGSIGRFHYGEEGDKGFLLWEIGAEEARFLFEQTPARRTIDIAFAGKPDLEEIRTAIAKQEIAGAFVRVRWCVPDEDSHEVDRAAIERMLVGAAEVKLEARILPVVRTRGSGMSRAATVAEKLRAWAQATEAIVDPLLACVEALETNSPERIVADVLKRQRELLQTVPPNASVAEAQASV